MEGYLQIITKGYSGTKAKKVWVVLDRQQLTYYSSLDLQKQQPTKLKGVLFIKDAKMTKVSEPGADHCLFLETVGGSVLFNCGEADIASTWYRIFTRAIKLHKEVEDKLQLPKQHKYLLGIDPTEPLTTKSIKGAYKRLSLKEHPDKGGNPDTFNKIREAHTYLYNMQQFIEELENTVAIHYEVVIKKQPGKVGLGLAITEDRLHERLLVSKVDEKIQIVKIGEEALGGIQPGDRLIGIDTDDCSHWFFTRLQARLNLNRVLIGGNVTFTLERRVAPETLEDQYSDEEDDESGNEGRFGAESNIESPSKSSSNYSPQPSLMPETVFKHNQNRNYKTQSESDTNTNSEGNSSPSRSPVPGTPIPVIVPPAPLVDPLPSAPPLPVPPLDETIPTPPPVSEKMKETDTKTEDPAVAARRRLEARQRKMRELEARAAEAEVAVQSAIVSSPVAVHSPAAIPVLTPVPDPVYIPSTLPISLSLSVDSHPIAVPAQPTVSATIMLPVHINEKTEHDVPDVVAPKFSPSIAGKIRDGRRAAPSTATADHSSETPDASPSKPDQEHHKHHHHHEKHHHHHHHNREHHRSTSPAPQPSPPTTPRPKDASPVRPRFTREKGVHAGRPSQSPPSERKEIYRQVHVAPKEESFEPAVAHSSERAQLERWLQTSAAAMDSTFRKQFEQERERSLALERRVAFLEAENGTLKGTINSLVIHSKLKNIFPLILSPTTQVNFMDQKHLENPQCCTDQVVRLEKELQEARRHIHILTVQKQTQFADWQLRSAHEQGDETDELCNKVEKLLVKVLMSKM